MALIPLQQGRKLFTDTFLGSWKESYPVTNFLRSFTTDKVVPSKFVSIEVSRGTKKIASDVMRGTESNRNKFGLSTLKTFQPPYYAESFTNEDLALYDQLFANYGESIDTELVKAAVSEVANNYLECKNKIERSYEVQMAEVLQLGTVTTRMQDTIDYKMKATHKATLSTKWDATTPNIFKSIKDFCDVLKQDGAAATEFDIIVGNSALQYLLDSDEYQKKYSLYQRSIAEYNLPRAELAGNTFINRIPVGPYIINIWSYNETYVNASGVTTQFIDPKKVVFIAKSFQAFASFAAVPRLLTANGIGQNPQFAQDMSGKYFLDNFVKPEISSHVFEIKSAGVIVPLTIDHFGCLTVLA